MKLNKDKIVYEDELPEMSDKDYTEWFKESWIDVVSVGYEPIFEYKESIKEFDKWSEETTACFRSDVDGDDFNVSFSELSFYDDLKEKVKQLIINNK